jgi:hypothetical protein
MLYSHLMFDHNARVKSGIMSFHATPTGAESATQSAKNGATGASDDF